MNKGLLNSLILDAHSPVAVYVQIAVKIREFIHKGIILPGSKLSERELANALNVGRATISAALDILKDENLIETVPKRGTYVKESVWTKYIENSVPDWNRFMKSGSFPEDSNLRYTTSIAIKPGSIYGFHEMYSPYCSLRQAYRNLADNPELDKFMNVFDYNGLSVLRDTLCKHLAKYEINVSSDNIVIFPGYIEAITTITLALLNQGDNVFCMQYDHLAIVPTFKSVGANIYKIPKDDEGLLPDIFEKKLQQGKLNMLYINPVNAFPSGITYSEKRINELREICLKNHVAIIENDFLRDIWTREPPKPMKARDESNQIIYIGAMANSFSTGARLAWAVLPNMIINRVLQVKTYMSTMNNNSNELIVNEILSKGYYDEYMDGFRKQLCETVRSANDSLNRHLSGMAKWNPKNINYTTWLEFNDGINTDIIIKNNPYHIYSAKVFTGKNNTVIINTLSLTPAEFDDMAYHCALNIK